MNAKLGFAFLFLAFVASATCQTVQFKVAARNLDSGDLIWGPPDPKARIFYAYGSNGFARVGETETQHTTNPSWPDVFSFQYVADLNQRVQIEIIEKDALIDDSYGSVTFRMDELLGAGTIERDFGKGILIVTPA